MFLFGNRHKKWKRNIAPFIDSICRDTYPPIKISDKFQFSEPFTDTHNPNTFPRGEGGRAKRGRKRNAGSNLTITALYQAFSICQVSPFLSHRFAVPPPPGGGYKGCGSSLKLLYKLKFENVTIFFVGTPVLGCPNPPIMPGFFSDTPGGVSLRDYLVNCALNWNLKKI